MGGWDRKGLDDLPKWELGIYSFFLIFAFFALHSFIFQRREWSLLWLVPKYIELIVKIIYKKAEQS